MRWRSSLDPGFGLYWTRNCICWRKRRSSNVLALPRKGAGSLRLVGRARNFEEAPWFGDALEQVLSLIHETETRAGSQIAHGACD